ncbi:uncharacterized protein J7T54_000023 [Emericellopsis cladophorae]|uniref:NACHT domain-containing protein n=1 Tax=Emericellopsis cladophorae TaxID=2686198 RepID=A0A9P9XUR6_9HYPO|nr:uncharacterized protein J7T54_000023 [Emericellopsis cladophorae]KAI6777885.1 hypothetical protein J7T54_000023 [Emericellopsis cladophorae]
MSSSRGDPRVQQAQKLPHAKPLVGFDSTSSPSQSSKGNGQSTGESSSSSKGPPDNPPPSAATGNGLPSVSMARGGGAIRGIGERFSVSPATGTAAASIPLPITSGRSGLTPELSLSYDSAAGNGPFGFGWQLGGLPSVGRKTDMGLPRYDDEGESDVFVITGSEDLVPMLEMRPGGVWYRPAPKRRCLGGVEYAVSAYRPRIEGSFARIERWIEIGSKDTHWRSISRSNQTTVFGEDACSRVADPDDPSKVFRWLASRTYDDRGNASVFGYKADNSEGVDVDAPHEAYRRPRQREATKYLKRIKYGNRVSRLVEEIHPGSEWLFELVFDFGDHDDKTPLPRESCPWSTRTDPFSSNRAGFELRTYRLCHRILMFHHFPGEVEMGEDTLVTSLDITYFHNGWQRSTGLSSATCASSFRKTAYRRAGDGYVQQSMPPIELDYSEAVISGRTSYLGTSALEGIPLGIQGDYQFLDMDGEGVPGILAHESGSYYYKSNLGDGNFAPPVALPYVPTLYANRSKSAAPPQWLDLRGDGKMDMVRFDGTTPGFYKRVAGDRGGVGGGGGGRGDTIGEVDDWQPFRPFRLLPNLEWRDPNTKFIDLTGDGHADILFTADEQVFSIYPSLKEDGFGSATHWRPPLDENKGPRLVLEDGLTVIYTADMSGDGLSDLVRVGYHEVCYWPNLGYGRFGHKVVMTNAPLLDSQDQFRQSRLHLADIDGSGTTDLVYLKGHETMVYLNQAGNGWTSGHAITALPATDDTTNIQVVDLLARGTGCLVWSSSAGSDQGTQVRYVDLMARGKPYLMTRTRNNLGSETRYWYTSSSTFYLRDKAAGNPWVTKLPFPVHVVERLESLDRVSKNKFTTRYAYHSGYYDGVEKEFRGFGMVETWDTEDIATLQPGRARQSEVEAWRGYRDASNWDSTSTVPPVLTKTWFHTGVCFPDQECSLESAFGRQYHTIDLGRRIPYSSATPNSIRVGDSSYTPYTLPPHERCEAFRALKGSVLRSEIYSRDGTPQAALPYTINQANFLVEMLQPGQSAGNPYAVFHMRGLESVQAGYDRRLYPVVVGKGQIEEEADPRTAHSLTLRTDAWGNILQTVALSYGRQFADASPLLSEQDHESQRRDYAILTENTMTNAIQDDDNWLSPLSAETRTYQLFNLLPTPRDHDECQLSSSFSSSSAAGRERRPLLEIDQLRAALAALDSGALDLPFESYDGPSEEHNVPRLPRRRLLQHTQSVYRADDLSSPLPVGVIESLALPFQNRQLAMSQRQVDAVFVADGKLTASETDHVLRQDGGYIRGEDGNWWTRTANMFLSPDRTHTPTEELAFARSHFFLSHRAEDAFSTPERPIDSIVLFDKYNLLVQEAIDPLGNRTVVGEVDETYVQTTGPAQTSRLRRPGQNYRVLQPTLVTDPNGNRNEAVLDVMGIASSPLDMLDDLLGKASSRILYDYHAFYKTRDDPDPQPAWSASLSREKHVSQLAEGEKSRITLGISYSDGFDRVVQQKGLAELGSSPGVKVTPRWVGSGWTVYNNKGSPVRQYEPFFAPTHRYQASEAVGVSPILLYDPVGRVVATLSPDHSWTKVRQDPWRAESWDANDTVLLSDPADDPDVGPYFQRLPRGDYLPTWHAPRSSGHMGREAKKAAERAAAHASTPRTVLMDAMGRTFAAFETVRTAWTDSPGAGEGPTTAQVWRNHAVLDIQGNQQRVIDSLGRLVSWAAYSYGGGVLKQVGLENGTRWALLDVLGKIILSWDGRGHRLRMVYDELRRPTDVFLRQGVPGETGEEEEGEEEVLVEQMVYGESRAQAREGNARVRIVEVRDQAGVTHTETYDFKGNILETEHTLAREYRGAIDWSRDDGVALEEETHRQSLEYDALSRVTATTLADGTVTKSRYNIRGLQESVSTWFRRDEAETKVLLHTEYNAKGQRTRSVFGNGTTTTNSYDPLTFRLAGITTRLKRRRHLSSGGREAGHHRHRLPSSWNRRRHPHRRRHGHPSLDIQGESYERRCVQDLRHVYDAAGNLSSIVDGPQQTVWHRNTRIDASQDFIYDSTYRLVEAWGREHLGAGRRAAVPSPDKPKGSSGGQPGRQDAHPGNGRAMGRYVERYQYDLASNMLRMEHRAVTAAGAAEGRIWTRHYGYEEPSALETGVTSNRLSWTRIGRRAERYKYEGSQGASGAMTSIPKVPRMQWNFRDQLVVSSSSENIRSRRKSSREPSDGDTTTMTHYRYDYTGKRVRKVSERVSSCPRAQGGDVDRRARLKETIYVGGAFEVFRKYRPRDCSEQGEAAPSPSTSIHGLAEDDVKLELQTCHILGAAGGSGNGALPILRAEFITVDSLLHGRRRPPARPPRLLRYQYANLQGSSTLELDEDGGTLTREEYTPFGATSYSASGRSVASPSLPPRRFRYAGAERDDATGLYCMGARYYAPGLGRWTSADPSGLADGLNSYVYAQCNPVAFSDPSGHSATTSSSATLHASGKRHDKVLRQVTTLLARAGIQGDLEVTVKAGLGGSRLDWLRKGVVWWKRTSIEFKTTDMWHFFDKAADGKRTILNQGKVASAAGDYLRQVNRHSSHLGQFLNDIKKLSGVPAKREALLIVARGFTSGSPQFATFASEMTRQLSAAANGPVASAILHQTEVNKAVLGNADEVAKVTQTAVDLVKQSEAAVRLARLQVATVAGKGLAAGATALMVGAKGLGVVGTVASTGMALATLADSSAAVAQKADAGVDLAANAMMLSGSPPLQAAGMGLSVGGAVGAWVNDKVEAAVTSGGGSQETAAVVGAGTGVLAGAATGAVLGATIGLALGPGGALVGAGIGAAAGAIGAALKISWGSRATITVDHQGQGGNFKRSLADDRCVYDRQAGPLETVFVRSRAMIAASLCQDMSLAGWTSTLCLLAAAIAACLWFCPTAAHSEHALSSPASKGSTQATRGVRLSQVSPDKTDTATDIDIIAVHGLDTKSPDTWTWRRPKPLWTRLRRAKHPENGVNWLQDRRMLPAAVERARIFTCDWPAELLQPPGLAQKRIDEYALLLLDGIQRRPRATNGARGEDRPLFFVASCLGGIILAKALVDADNENSSYCRLRRATRGIVFLATPFRGTSFQDVAAWAEPGLKAWAGVRGRESSRLLDSAKGSTLDLEALVRRFTQLCQDDDYPCDVFNFYELGMTSLPSKVLPWLPAWLRREKPLVDSSSATLDMVQQPLPLDRPHVLTNKFEHPKYPDYEKVAGKIQEMLHRIREGSPLKQADDWIRKQHYNDDRLKIERLSGELLSMEQCYINLAIVEQHRKTVHHWEKNSEEEDVASKSSPFSLYARPKAETPDKTIQVDLPAVFNPRKREDGEVNPRRILIRGRAGVGKTTLCKRIVYDFTRHGTWAHLFDRVLWMTLRKLKARSATGYNLENLFTHEYFWNRPGDGRHLANALVRAIQDGRTLFILDGLDEVSDLLDPDHEMFDFLKWLLDQRNVIITSRPYTKLPTTITLDLELETIGFYPDQVTTYLQNTFPDPQKTSKIRSFLQDHQLMQGLVRIPVQLDALCFTWNEGFDSAVPLNTMTAVYQAIEQRLWKKDVPRLNKKYDGELVIKLHIESASGFRIEALAEHEISFLEGLSFTGMHNDVIEFDQQLLNEAFDRFAPDLLPDATLPRLSFLRTSNLSSEIGNRSCHFLHLTYQEYFAARYFVRQWRASPPKNLVLASRDTQDVGATPIEYLGKHKYTARYDILWRFVAGLLDTEGKAEEFFDEIRKEPIDLLGLTHQRLVIYCLSEVQARPQSSFAALRTRLEDHLVEWLLFECKYRSSSSLAREMELPSLVLWRALQGATDEGRVKLVDALRLRHSIPTCVADLLESWLEPHALKELVIRILAILGPYLILFDEILTRVGALLDNSDRFVRQAAVQALAAREQLSDEILTRVVARLDDSHENVRLAAVRALAAREQLSDEILTQVAALLDDSHEDVREAAVQALAVRERLSDEILTRVAELLDDSDLFVQEAAVQALAAREQLSDEILTRVAALLDDGDQDVLQVAVEALAAREQLSDEILTQVVAWLNASHEDIRQAAVQALAAREQLSDEILTQVAALLDDSHEDVREAAVQALAAREQLSDEILTRVAALLDDSDLFVREAAVQALAAREQLSDEILTQVVAWLNASHEDIREAAVRALAAREQLSDEILTQVAALLDDSHENVRLAAVRALAAREQLSDEILTRVAARLDNSDKDVRQGAVYVTSVGPRRPKNLIYKSTN